MKWYELSDEQQAHELAEHRKAAARFSDYELLTWIRDSASSALGDWIDSSDAGFVIACEVEAYARQLLGPGRKVCKRFEEDERRRRAVEAAENEEIYGW